MKRLTRSLIRNINILPDQTLRVRMVLSHIHGHNVLRSSNIVAPGTFYFYVLADLDDSLQVGDGQDKAEEEKNYEQERPNLIYGVTRLQVGVEVDVPNESQDAGAESYCEHDVEHQPGEEAEDEVPDDGHHQEDVTHHLTGQSGQ